MQPDGSGQHHLLEVAAFRTRPPKRGADPILSNYWTAVKFGGDIMRRCAHELHPAPVSLQERGRRFPREAVSA